MRKFVIRKACAATRTVRCNAMVLNKQTLLPDLFQTPPHAFNIFWSHRPICLIKIDPEAHAFSHGGKRIHVTCNRFATLIVEGSDSIFFDIALTRETEFFFNSNFNRKSMTVPSSFTCDVLSLHCLIARENIFKYTRFNMVRARHSICSWGTFIKCPRCTAGTRLCALMEDVVIAPEMKNGTFHRWKINRSGNCAKW